MTDGVDKDLMRRARAMCAAAERADATVYGIMERGKAQDSAASRRINARNQVQARRQQKQDYVATEVTLKNLRADRNARIVKQVGWVRGKNE